MVMPPPCVYIDCTDGVCWEHDSGGYSAVAIFTNVAPPFAWYVDDNDVRPYIMALQLDGNPVVPTKQWIPKKLNRPALYQGATTDKYLVCRPTIY